MKYKHCLNDFKVTRKLALFSIPNLLNKFESKKQKILCVGEVQSGKTRIILEIIESAFRDFQYNIVVFFGGTNKNLNNQSYQRIKKNFDFDRYNVLLKSFSRGFVKNQKVLYVDPKLNHSLEALCQTFSYITDIDKYKILIIDDESDFGSINTKKCGESKYYSQIHQIYSSTKRGGLISVTATPYANLINSKEKFPYNSLFVLPSKTEDVYTGVSYFKNIFNFYLNIDRVENEDILCKFKNRPLDYNQLAFCIGVYIINTIIKEASFHNKKSDFLINTTYTTRSTSNSQKSHDLLEKQVNDIISHFRNNPNSTLSWLRTLTEVLKKEIVFDWNSVDSLLKELVVQKLNGVTDYDTKIHNKNIYIGGVLLSRGITYHNLTTELITNFAKTNISIDTLLQMCRWFGYRDKLEVSKCMNVLTNTQGIASLEEACNYNKVFFNESNSLGTEIDIAECISKIRQIEKNSNRTKGCLNDKR